MRSPHWGPFTHCLFRCSSSKYPFVLEIYLLSNVRLNWNQHSWSFWSLVISIPYHIEIYLDAYKMSGPSRWAHLSGCKCTRIACPEEWIHWKGGSLRWDGSINCVKQPFYGNHLSSSSSSQVFPASFKDPTSEEALWQSAACLQLAGTAPYNVQTPFLGLISKTLDRHSAPDPNECITCHNWCLYHMSQLVCITYHNWYV